jgi:peptidoglycan hydrolase-like protein with peptidoglycan-binding domain
VVRTTFAPDRSNAAPRRLRILAVLLAMALLAAACGSDDGGDGGSGESDAQSGAESGSDSGGASASRAEIDAILAAQPNPAIIYLQEILDTLGYDPGPIDGQRGAQTVEAVQAFQADQNLETTGVVDATTARAMVDQSPKALELMVGAIQLELTELGYYEGLIDSQWGPQTEEAIVRLQESAGLEPSGEMTDETWGELQDAYLGVVAASIEASGYAADVAAADSGESNEGGVVYQRGDAGPEVQAIQERLAELGYRPGTPDGNYGAATASAVLAFQKAEGLQRDGQAGPAVVARLESPQAAGPESDAPGPRVEVDLDRQIAFFIAASGEVTTINISSGSGREYEKPDGGTAVAYTPTGDFAVERRIDGLREAPLGSLYYPLYFKDGWAIHGSSSVPAYPASHGCVRTANEDQDFLFAAVGDGDPVEIYGTSEGAPEEGEAGF